MDTIKKTGAGLLVGLGLAGAIVGFSLETDAEKVYEKISDTEIKITTPTTKVEVVKLSDKEKQKAELVSLRARVVAGHERYLRQIDAKIEEVDKDIVEAKKKGVSTTSSDVLIP